MPEKRWQQWLFSDIDLHEFDLPDAFTSSSQATYILLFLHYQSPGNNKKRSPSLKVIEQNVTFHIRSSTRNISKHGSHYV